MTKVIKFAQNRITQMKPFLSQQRWQTTTATSNLKTLNDMPGLQRLPLIGVLHHFIPVIGKIGFKRSTFELLQTLESHFGDIIRLDILPRSTVVVMFNPDHYDKVFRSEDHIPSRPGFQTMTYYRTVMRKSTYDGVYGLTTAEGPQWREFRSKVNPALLMPKLVKLYTPTISEVSDDMIGRLKKFKDDHDYINKNFHLEMTKFALESIGVVGLGTRIGCLEDDLPEHHPARQLIKAALDILNLSFKLEFYPIAFWKLFSTPNFNKIVKAFDSQWDISEKFIKEAKKNIGERKNVILEENKSVIERLLEVDEKVAVMMANEMLFAGIDTVAFSIMGVLYHLANDSERQNKLREEIRSNDTRRSYLRACIKEALRIWPVVPGNLRRTTKEHIVDGYLIPKGVDVVSPNEVLSKSEKHYPQPFNFIPERWTAEKSDPLYYGNTNPLVTQPFGFGVRTCIGRRIAELEIEMLISKIVDNFEVSWEGPPIKVVTKVTNTFVTPYSYRFKNLK